MRSILRVCLNGCLLALAAGGGCADLDAEGRAGRGGAANDAGDAANDVSAAGGSSGGPFAEGGPDADSDADSASQADSAAAIASCKAAADGAACTTCACERCIGHISKCNEDRRCRAVLDCAARTGCRDDCAVTCRDVIFAAEGSVYFAAMASNCRAEQCATECEPGDASTDADAHSADGSTDGADGADRDARTDAESDAPLNDAALSDAPQE